MKALNFSKLLKSKDVRLLTIDPNAKYWAIINIEVFSKSEIEDLMKAIPQIGTSVLVRGNPDEAMAIYEIDQEKHD